MIPPRTEWQRAFERRQSFPALTGSDIFPCVAAMPAVPFCAALLVDQRPSQLAVERPALNGNRILMIIPCRLLRGNDGEAGDIGHHRHPPREGR